VLIPVICAWCDPMGVMPHVSHGICATHLGTIRVALGMARVASERRSELGEAILPVVVASTVLFELLGPVATRFALERAAEESAQARFPLSPRGA